VAKFARIYFKNQMLSRQSYRDGNFPVALRETFHRIDELLEDMVGIVS
jgi:hypothetical protein